MSLESAQEFLKDVSHEQPMSEQVKQFYEFGRFRINSAQRLLLRDQEIVPLTPKVFDMLVTLVESSGEVVSKDFLMKKVWPDTFVEEGNLTQNISLLRKALGEGQNGHQYIETVARRGYRFVAPVRVSLGNEFAREATGVGTVTITEPARTTTLEGDSDRLSRGGAREGIRCR